MIAHLNPELERRVLLHEMIHADLYLHGDRNAEHGPRFVAELARLVKLGETWAAIAMKAPGCSLMLWPSLETEEKPRLESGAEAIAARTGVELSKITTKETTA